MIHNTTVTTAAASRSFVAQATVTAELPSGASTSRVDSLILSVSGLVARYLTREPWLATYSSKIPGRGGSYLKLPRWPIQTVASVTEGLGSSPSTITASTYSVAGNTRRDRLYREDGWSYTREELWRPMTSSAGPNLTMTVAYTAGWVMPDQITEWSVGATVAASSWYSATDDDEPFIFQADATGGTTHAATEPTWPTVAGGTVTDNGITWTAYDQRLPHELEEIALSLVLDWFNGGLQVPAGIASESAAGFRIDYRADAPAIPRPVAAALAAYR